MKKQQYVELNGYNNTIIKLKEEIKELRKSIERKPADEINEARHALSKCTEYKNRSEEAKKEIELIRREINSKKNDISSVVTSIKGSIDNINSVYSQSKEASVELNQLQEKIEIVDSLYEQQDDLTNKIDELTDSYKTGTDLSNKVEALYNSIKSTKNEIEIVSNEVLGYYDEIENDNEEANYNEGLKDKLEKSFNVIKQEIKEFNDEVEELKESTNNQYNEFIEDRKEEYEGLVKEVEELLPRALTNGLSSAYSKKKDDEIEEKNNLNIQFTRSILGLIIISLIPFMASIYLILGLDKDIISVIKDMPNMVFAMFPLYVPFVWLAYSSSKKLNLSKRLIEEYTHKEVLSKTFEGLSKQIENIKDDTISSELRIKLLYNILSVNSENPGKLISDYNKADHPLLDALDKSAKLSDAVESISKIPGLSKLTKILDEKANKLQKEQDTKVNSGLEAVVETDKKEQ